MDTFVASVGRAVCDIITQPKRENAAEWRRGIILVLCHATSSEAVLMQRHLITASENQVMPISRISSNTCNLLRCVIDARRPKYA
jgi:hypothetical protein